MNFRLNEACSTSAASSTKAPMASAITAFLRPEGFGSSRIGLDAAKTKGSGPSTKLVAGCPHYRAPKHVSQRFVSGLGAVISIEQQGCALRFFRVRPDPRILVREAPGLDGCASRMGQTGICNLPIDVGLP